MMKKTTQLLAFTLLSSLGVNSLHAHDQVEYQHQERFYIGTGNAGIYTSLLNEETGQLSKAHQVSESQGTGFLVSSPDKTHLYSTARIDGKGGVASFRRTPNTSDGALTLLNQESSQGSGTCHVSLDATGRLLLLANYGSGSVASCRIKENGQLSPVVSFIQHHGSSVHPQRQKGPHAHSIYAGPDNKFAYAPDLGTDEVVIYKLDATKGTLTPSSSAKTPPGAGPRHLKFSRNGHQAYVLSEIQLNILTYDRDPESGQLTLSSEVSTLADDSEKERMSCSEIRVSADGRFVYCANRDLTGTDRDSISVFSVNDTGGLQRIQIIPAEVWIPRNIKLSPSGKWLLVAGQKSNEVSLFKVSRQNGTLSYTKQKITVPNAKCIEF